MAKNKKTQNTKSSSGTAHLRNINLTYRAVGVTPNPGTVDTVNARSDGKGHSSHSFDDILRQVSRRRTSELVA